MRALTTALCLSVLAGPTFAAANPTVVVHGMDPQTVASVWLQQNGPSADPRFVPVDEVFDPDSQVVVLGDTVVSGCTGERTDGAVLASRNALVVDSFTDMEYLAAAKQVEASQALLPCLSSPPSIESLGQHHFLRGIVAFEAEGPAVAEERFEEALLISPFLQWDERYPPTVRPTFEEAVQGALSAQRAFVTVSERILEDGSLWIDGVSVDRRTRTTTLYAGTHLVQWRPEGGELAAWSVQAAPGQSLTLVHRADAVSEVLTGRAGAEVTSYVRSRVLAPVEPGGVLVVAEEAEIVLFHRYEPEAGEWVLADVRDLLDYRQRGRRMQAGGTALTIGGVVLGLSGLVLGGLAGVEGLLIRYDIAEADDPQAEFVASAPDYARAQQFQRIGAVFAIGGGGAAIAGIPLQILGKKRSKAHGVGKKRTP